MDIKQFFKLAIGLVSIYLFLWSASLFIPEKESGSASDNNIAESLPEANEQPEDDKIDPANSEDEVKL